MKIAARSISISFFIITISVAVSSYIGINITKRSIQDTRIHSLDSIADLKVSMIETFFRERVSDMVTAQDYYNIKTNLPIMTRYAKDSMNPAYTEAEKMLDDQLGSFQKTNNYIDIMLVGPDGKIVYVANEAHAEGDLGHGLPCPDKDKAFEEGSKGIYLTDVFENKLEGYKFEMIVIAPAHDFNGRFIGCIAFEIDMEPVYTSTQDTTGLGKTGETLIGKKTSDGALVINTLRHDPEAALKRKVIFGEKAGFPIQEAVLGRKGHGLSTDYRGKEVLAVWRNIPSLDWGLVAKIDKQEVFALIIQMSKVIIISCIGILVFALTGAFFFSMTITNPVKKLSDMACKISHGDMTEQITVKSKDEIGSLASSFEGMRIQINKTLTDIEGAKQDWESTFNSVSDIVILYDKDCSLVRCNDVLLRRLDIKQEEIVGKRCYDVLHHEDSKHECLVAKTSKSLKPFSMEREEPRLGGIYMVSVFPRYNEEGGFVGTVQVLRDITEQKEAENRLKVSEGRLREAQRIARLGNWNWDIVRNELSWSEEVYHIYGLGPREFGGTYEAFLNLVHPEDRKFVKSSVETALLEGRPYNIDIRIVLPDGTVRIVNDQAVVVSNDKGRAVEMSGTVQDVTGRKLIENNLRVRERQQAAVSRIGLRALEDIELDTLMYETAVIVATTLGVEFCRLLEFLPDGKALLLRAGVGWREGYVGRYTEGMDTASQAAYIMDTGRPVIVKDLRTERRFGIPPLLSEHGVISCVNVPVRCKKCHFGILGAHTTRQKTFTDDDVHFLQSVANVISEAIERAGAEKEIEASEARLSNIIESSSDGIVIVDGGITRFVNPAAASLLGRSADELIGDTFGFPTVSGETTEIEIVRRGREDAVAEMRVSDVEWDNRKALMATLRDITERKRYLEHLDHVARYDVLTDLPNRILFLDRITRITALAKRDGEQIALLNLNLDRFKVINDTLGHEAGDQILVKISRRLTGCVREVDTVSRIGSDEFALILRNVVNVGSINKISNKILRAVSKPVMLDGKDIHVTASIGISVYPHDDRDVKGLIRKAGTAMRHAKEVGRNTYTFYDNVMKTSSYETLMLEEDMRKAIKNREFLVYYQPQVDLKTGRAVGVEALVRWNNQKKGLVSPSEFIPLAEETGLIISIDRWVLHTALSKVRAWREDGLPHMKASVNYSAVQFMQKDPVKPVRKALQEISLEPGCLELEITESVTMKGAEETIRKFKDLKDLGINISMDDFGTGYSSLNYLKRFPIDTLKIDQSFARDVLTDPHDAAIVAAIIAMAHGLGIKTVAEGVETREQLEFFRSLKCDMVQGYVFSRPLPAEEITAILGSDLHI